MRNTERLVEQHIRESESHLRHIDELSTRARKAASAPATASEVLEQVGNLAQDRHRLAKELADVRDLPVRERATKVQESEGIEHGLEAIGQQLEKLLAAVLNSRY